MSATVRLTQLLADAVGTDVTQVVSGSSIAEVLENLDARSPGLRGHIVDETGAIRPHVAVFVDGDRARLETEVREDAAVYVLHAVSGG